jgi:hypothetical protein
MIDLPGINARVRISGISKVELSVEELELVLQTLVYDARLEEVWVIIRVRVRVKVRVGSYFLDDIDCSL